MTEVNKIGKEHHTTMEDVYYDSGELLSKIPKLNGKTHGLVESYYKSGVLKRREQWINGKSHGLCWGYYESSNLRFELINHNGLKHGAQRNYADAVIYKVIETIYWFNDEMVSLEEYSNPLGNLTRDEPRVTNANIADAEDETIEVHLVALLAYKLKTKANEQGYTASGYIEKLIRDDVW